MNGEYLGHLPDSDPLYGYLKFDIFPQLGIRDAAGFRVFRMNASNAVYLYEERHSGVKVIGKFFGDAQGAPGDAAARRLEREFRNLQIFRDCGFNGGGCHYVARPLGRNHSLCRLLVIEFCYGEPLDSIIRRSIGEHDRGLLFRKLTALAWFLASLHNRTASPDRKVDFDESCSYMNCLSGVLAGQRMTGGGELAELAWLRDRWRDRSCMWEDRAVLVHGDATPSNFLFGDRQHVISFDLERVRLTDRVFDVGRLAGELKHFFLCATGNGVAAEPFIGHFLWEYACHFPDRDRAFASITRRVPFYMGLTLLRIARNNYLSRDYRRRLIDEAKECLR